MGKNKEYYKKQFLIFWDKCFERAKWEAEESLHNDYDELNRICFEIFNDLSNAEQVIGYYIETHREFALKDWEDNVCGKTLTKKDKEIDRELKRLYRK